MYFLAKKNFFSKLTPPIPIQSGRVGKNEVLCRDQDISCIFLQNKFLVKLPLTHHPWELGLVNLSFVHFWKFNAFSNKHFLLNLASTSHVGGKFLEFLGELVFNCTL